MKNPAGIPENVLRFIDERIDSVPQLETLLMMHDEPQREWSAGEIAARAYVKLDEAERILQALNRRGLIESIEGRPAFRIRDHGGEQRAIVEEVARTYRANLSRIATLIHEKPSMSIREFARAFDFKKDG